MSKQQITESDPRITEIAEFSNATPAEVLTEAKEIAQAEHVSLSESLDEGVAVVEMLESLSDDDDDSDDSDNDL